MKFYCSRQVDWRVCEVAICDGDGSKQSWRPVVFRGMGAGSQIRAAVEAAYLDWAGRYDDSPPKAEQYVIDWDEVPDDDGWYSAEVKGDQEELLAMVSVRSLTIAEMTTSENGDPQMEGSETSSADVQLPGEPTDPSMSTATAIGARLREAREYLGLPQDAVAEALGMPLLDLGDLEGGHREATTQEVERLSILYRRPVDWILTGAEPEVSEETLALVEGLSEHDRETVLKFAGFLALAGAPNQPGSGAETALDDTFNAGAAE